MARILIVDDEPDLRGMVRLILELDGHQVHEAHHGRAALERLAEIEVDLVITDVMMPIMSGNALIDRLRAEKSTAELPIIVLSASPHHVANANRVMHKPFEPRDLRNNVKALVTAP